MPFRTSEDLGYDVPPLLLLHALIHRSAWNRNSANFAFPAFSEVRWPVATPNRHKNLSTVKKYVISRTLLGPPAKSQLRDASYSG